MKQLFTLLFFITMMTSMQSQSVIGKWKTIDDTTGEAKSIVEVFSKSGKIYANVVDILDPVNINKVPIEPYNSLYLENFTTHIPKK